MSPGDVPKLPGPAREAHRDDRRYADPTIPRADPVNAYTMGGIIRDAGLTIEAFKKAL
jgi:hypothetical protein